MSETEGKYWLEEPTNLEDYSSPDVKPGEKCWVPLNCAEHGGFGLLVWKMEGVDKSPDQEARATKVVSILNSHEDLVSVLDEIVNQDCDLDKAFEKAKALLKTLKE